MILLRRKRISRAIRNALLALAVWLWILWHRRLILAAMLEQGRREFEHHIRYRPDQRLRAIQQRLERNLGRRAHSPLARRALESLSRDLRS